MKKMYFVLVLVLMLSVSFLGITYSYELNDDNLLKFELNGDYEVYLNMGESYYEAGVKVYNGLEDISHMVNIDQSMVDTNKVGTYKVKYEVTLDGFSEHIYRIVHVVGEDDSVIRLLGEETVYLNVFELYEDAGYEVLDDNLKYDVIVTTNLDVTRVGEYMINYVFSYENGGKNVFFRKIIVY